MYVYIYVCICITVVSLRNVPVTCDIIFVFVAKCIDHSADTVRSCDPLNKICGSSSRPARAAPASQEVSPRQSKTPACSRVVFFLFFFFSDPPASL